VRRADRLFQIVQFLRRRRVTTAARLAEELEVSERTIYRDIRDLVASGIPIEGEAGVGYALPRGFDLPPLMFTNEEIQALVLGARLVKAWADPELAKAADQVLSKVEIVLPERLRSLIDDRILFAPRFWPRGDIETRLAPLRRAVLARNKVELGYTRRDGQRSARVIHPLGLFFWGRTWTLASWCEMRRGFRNFRVDRIERLSVLEEGFAEVPGQTLDDFLRHVEDEPAP